MVIRTINAHKGTTNKGIARRAQGRSTAGNQETAKLAVRIQEGEERAGGAGKAEGRKDRPIGTENVRRMLLKEYLMKETHRAGFGGLDIQRTPMGTRVTLIAERPGLVIGRKGGSINALTEAVQNRFKFDTPQIEVQEGEN